MWHQTRVNEGKPCIVLLHGWGMDSRVWGGFADALAEHFSLFLIDLPGLGRSDVVPSPYTTEAVAKALEGITPDKAIWIGWSMGGQIATAFAAQHPERVTQLITLASNPCFVQKNDWPCAMPQDAHGAFEKGIADNPAKTLTRFAMLQTQGADQGKDILKQLKTLHSDAQPTGLYESLAPLREDTRQALQSLSMPVLQIFGSEDKLVPVTAASACEALTAQPVVICEGAGHLPFLSHQTQVVDEILRFVGN